MKRYLHDFRFTYSFVKNRVFDCINKGRWTRKDTSMFLAGYLVDFYYEKTNKKENVYTTARQIRNIAYSDERYKLYPLLDYISMKIFLEIKNNDIKLSPIHYQLRKDKSSDKEREIGISSIKQQCYDYIAVGVCKKMFHAKIGQYQCASVPNRGQVYGKRAIEKWIRKNPTKCKWVYKCDIKKYYPSVDHEMIKKYLARDIKNTKVLYLLYYLIDTYKDGLCIGSYLCQYLANYYLSYLYHFLEMTKISHQLFYMDDIIMFCPNKRELSKIIIQMKKYLFNNMKLEIKSNEQLFMLDSRDIDMMGYRMTTERTIIRKRIYKRANKLYSKIKYPINSLKKAYRVISYYGYFKHSSSTKYIKSKNIRKILKYAKEKISYENKNNNNSRIA